MNDLVTYRPLAGGRAQQGGDVVTYIVFGKSSVLYVGQTNDIRRRLREHRRLASWWHEVTEVLYVVAHDRLGARRGEAALIGEINPPFNMLGRTA